jgi:hypothetical protein
MQRVSAIAQSGGETGSMSSHSSPFPLLRGAYATDEMDKRFLRRRAIFGSRERPHDEAWHIDCKRRQASPAPIGSAAGGMSDWRRNKDRLQRRPHRS